MVTGEAPDLFSRSMLVQGSLRGRRQLKTLGGSEARNHVREALLELGEWRPGDDAGSLSFERLRGG